MPKRVEGVGEWREIGGQVVLLHRGELLANNAAGTMIWELLAEPRSTEELEDSLRSAWPDRDVGRDLQAFLDRLRELGLLESE